MDFTLQELKEIENALMVTQAFMTANHQGKDWSSESLDKFERMSEILDRVRIIINHG